MTRAALIALVLLAAGPVFALDSGYKTWDGQQCLIHKTGALVVCTPAILEAIDRDTAASAVVRGRYPVCPVVHGRRLRIGDCI